MLLFFDGYIGTRDGGGWKQKVLLLWTKIFGFHVYFIIDMLYVVGLVLANVVKMASQY